MAQRNIRNKKDRISKVLTHQRDRLQTLYDWNTVGLQDHEVAALSDLISQMGKVIGVMKQ